MNKNAFKIFSVATLAFALTACGGGGSDVGDGTSGNTGGGTSTNVILGQNGAVDVNTQGQFAIDVLNSVNTIRATARTCGTQQMPAVPAVSWNSLLTAAAVEYANDMATNDYFNFDHTSEDGRTAYQRITNAGYAYSNIGEIIAAGQPDLASVMQAWVDSPGHCQVLMSASLKEIGGAQGVNQNSTHINYWVIDFGTPAAR